MLGVSQFQQEYILRLQLWLMIHEASMPVNMSLPKLRYTLLKLRNFIVENQLIKYSCFRLLSEYFETFEKRTPEGDLEQLWHGYAVHYAVP